MWRALLAGLLFSVLASSVEATELRGSVRDETGAIKNAVIYATPLNGSADAEVGTAVIDQVNKLYVPFVSAIPAGTTVTFPNKDDIKHHLYSVSPTKPFERPLYKGQKAAPVLFDKPGEVILGCNIHDWMIAHLLVLDTPYAAVTDDHGRAVIADLPVGEYLVRVWHPGMKGKKNGQNNPRKINLLDSTNKIEFTISLRSKKMWYREKPKDADKEYSGDKGSGGQN